MAVSLIERVPSGTSNGSQTISSTHGLSLTETPATGDVVIVVFKSVRGTPRTVSSVTGLGATWADGYSGTRIEFWVGTGATASGEIVVTQSGAGHAQATAYLIRGLTASTGTGSQTTATGTSLTGPAQTATTGQMALTAATTSGAALTFPSAETPAGWSSVTPIALFGGDVGDAHRIPSASASHRTDAAADASTGLTSTIFVIGEESTGGPTGLPVETDAALPATAIVGAVVTTGLATETDTALAGSVGDGSQTVVTGLATETDTALPAAADGSPVTITTGLALETDMALDATYVGPVGTAPNRVGGRVRDGLGVVNYSPPVTLPPATVVEADAYDVATAIGPVTMVGPRPTYATSVARKRAHRTRIVVGGKDVTFFRDVATPAPSYQLMEPLSYGPATLMFPQIVACFETAGVGSLKWLKPGASVVIQRVDRDTDAVVATDYVGVIIGLDASGRDMVAEVGGALSGRAALRNRQPRIFRGVRDIGRHVYDAVNRHGLKFSPHLGPTVGIQIPATGSMSELDHLLHLCAMAQDRAGNQWTIRHNQTADAWELVRKDTTTVDATIYADGARIVQSLRRDIAEEPNRVYATGVTPAGRRVRFAVYPGLNQGDASPYPFNDGRTFGEGTTNEDTDTGDGVAVMNWRLITMGYLSRSDLPGGFDKDVTEAILELQDDAGLTETGNMTLATWDALYDLNATGFSLRHSIILPAAERSNVKKWRRTASGSVSQRNPSYDPHALVSDVNIDTGSGFKRGQIREFARAELSPGPAWTGTITIPQASANVSGVAVVAGNHTPGDPITTADVMSARVLRPGMNVRLPHFNGGTLFHISSVTVGDGSITLAVDTRARDAMKVWQVIQRNRETRRDPARTLMSSQRSSTIPKDAIGEWDGEMGGVTDAVPCKGGKWTVFPVVAGQEGQIRRLRIRTTPNAEYVAAVFGRSVSPARLASLIGNPLTEAGTERWDHRKVRKALAVTEEGRWLLYSSGTHDEPLGFFPGSKTAGLSEITGEHDDAAGTPYFAKNGAILYVAVYSNIDTTIQAGRIMWPQLEVGS